MFVTVVQAQRQLQRQAQRQGSCCLLIMFKQGSCCLLIVYVDDLQ